MPNTQLSIIFTNHRYLIKWKVLKDPNRKFKNMLVTRKEKVN